MASQSVQLDRVLTGLVNGLATAHRYRAIVPTRPGAASTPGSRLALPTRTASQAAHTPRIGLVPHGSSLADRNLAETDRDLAQYIPPLLEEKASRFGPWKKQLCQNPDSAVRHVVYEPNRCFVAGIQVDKQVHLLWRGQTSDSVLLGAVLSASNRGLNVMQQHWSELDLHTGVITEQGALLRGMWSMISSKFSFLGGNSERITDKLFEAVVQDQMPDASLETLSKKTVSKKTFDDKLGRQLAYRVALPKPDTASVGRVIIPGLPEKTDGFDFTLPLPHKETDPEARIIAENFLHNQSALGAHIDLTFSENPIVSLWIGCLHASQGWSPRIANIWSLISAEIPG